MDAKKLHIRILPAAVVLAGLLALQWAWMPKPTAAEQRQFSEKINLAMRQAAHRLLTEAGNFTDKIAPVEQVAGNEFSLRLENDFNYDCLPDYLQSAFEEFGIDEDYYVAVKNCFDANSLVLGYTLSDFTKKGEVACSGREQDLDCYNLSVTFLEIPAASLRPAGWQRLSLMGGFLVSLGYVGFVLFGFRKNKNLEPTELLPATGGELLRFGHTTFDVANQTVTTGKTQQELTFREAKLLHVFCKNTNQLLDRNKLLEEVWGDEGVIVGRSLDVFVSRLRKILKEDESIQIVNVHSVGYRLEIVDKIQ